MPQTRQLTETPPADVTLVRELVEVPFFPQEQYQCGPASLAMLLQASGVSVGPEELVPRVFVPERQGSFQVEMLAAARAYGRVSMPIDPTLYSLIRWLDAGQPVLVLQNLGLNWYPFWHYAVVVGYQLDDRKLILRTGITERYVVDMSLFERTWARADFWGMVALPPGQLPVAEDSSRYFQAVAAFERSADPQMANKAWRAGVRAWGDSLPMWMGLGNNWYGQGRYADAEDAYRAVIQRQPAYGPAYNNLAEVKIRQGQYQEAIELASEAMARDPDRRSIYAETWRKAKELHEQ